MNYDISEKYVVKGTAFSNIRSFIDKRFGVGTFRKIAGESGVANPGLIVASKWYPGSQYVGVLLLAAKQAGQDMQSFCVQCTTYILETDLNGVYKFFIKMGGPQMVMSGVPKMAKTYNNIFTYQVLSNENGKHLAAIRYPEKVRDWALGTAEGGVRGILTVCKKPLLKFTVLEDKKVMVDGEELLETRFEVNY